MVDKWVIKAAKKHLITVAKLLKKWHISADQVSWMGFALGIVSFFLITQGFFLSGLVFIFLNRLADGVDGTLARLTKKTDKGAFLDITLDFIFYSLIPLGFIWHDPAQNALAGACVIFSFVGTGVSFLAFAIIAEKRKLKSLNFPQKSFYYLGGLTEASETIGFFTLSALVPSLFPYFAYVFATLCIITTIMRMVYGWQTFTEI